MGLFMNGYKVDESPGALSLNGQPRVVNKINYNGSIIWDTKISQTIGSFTGIHHTHDMCETYDYVLVATNNNLSVNVYRKSSSGDRTLSLERTLDIGAEVLGIHSYYGVTGYPGQPIVIITASNVYIYSTYDFSLGTTLSNMGTFNGSCAMSRRTLALGQEFNGSYFFEGRVLVYDMQSYNTYYISNPAPSNTNKYFGKNIAISAQTPSSSFSGFTQIHITSERYLYSYTSRYVSSSVPVTYSFYSPYGEILGLAAYKYNALQESQGVVVAIMTNKNAIHIGTLGGGNYTWRYDMSIPSGYSGGKATLISGQNPYELYLVFQNMTKNSIGGYVRSTEIQLHNISSETLIKSTSILDPYMVIGGYLPFNTIASKSASDGLYVYTSATAIYPTFYREIFLYKI